MSAVATFRFMSRSSLLPPGGSGASLLRFRTRLNLAIFTHVGRVHLVAAFGGALDAGLNDVVE